MVGKAELALEGARRDTLIEIFALALLGLAAFDRHRVLLGGNGNLVGREAGNGKRNLIAVFVQPLDIVGRVVTLADALRGFDEVEKAVEADGRAPEGCEVVCAHSQILQKSKLVTSGTGHDRCPSPDQAHQAPGPPSGGSKKIRKPPFGFKSTVKIFGSLPARLRYDFCAA